MLTCKVCHVSKDTSHFRRRSDRKSGYAQTCKECRQPNIAATKKLQNGLSVACKVCFEEKSRVDFYSHVTDGILYYQRECKQCHYARTKVDIPYLTTVKVKPVNGKLTCLRCRQEKVTSDYPKSLSKTGLGCGVHSTCKDCSQAQNVANRLKRPEECARVTREYRKRRYETDVQYKLAQVLRNRFRCVINAAKVTKQGVSAVRDLGCTLAELKARLEERFQPGMTWENYGFRGWHVDHIRPLASFDLTDAEQLKAACHYTNLQPLWATDNLKKIKHDKILIKSQRRIET